MSETNTSYVTKAEFWVVSLILVALAVAAILVFLVPLQRDVNDLRRDVNDVKGDVRRLLSKSDTTTPDTPILVRGGAMTAFTIAPSAGWGQAPYCLNTPVTTIAFTNEAATTPTPAWNKLNSTWTLMIHSQHHGSGLQFVAQAKDCSGDTSKTSVLLTAVNGAFYLPPALPPFELHTDSLRFSDTAPGCQRRTDREYCERMGEVDLTGSGTQTAQCVDGDCWITIGK
jgi:hypothetical protein